MYLIRDVAFSLHGCVVLSLSVFHLQAGFPHGNKMMAVVLSLAFTHLSSQNTGSYLLSTSSPRCFTLWPFFGYVLMVPPSHFGQWNDMCRMACAQCQEGCPPQKLPMVRHLSEGRSWIHVGDTTTRLLTVHNAEPQQSVMMFWKIVLENH